MEYSPGASRYPCEGSDTPLHRDGTVRDLVLCLRRLAGQFRAYLSARESRGPAPFTAVDRETATAVFRRLDDCRLILAERLAAGSNRQRSDEDVRRLSRLVATARASELAGAQSELEALFQDTRRLEGQTAAMLRQWRSRTGCGPSDPVLGAAVRGVVQRPDPGADKGE